MRLTGQRRQRRQRRQRFTRPTRLRVQGSLDDEIQHHACIFVAEEMTMYDGLATMLLVEANPETNEALRRNHLCITPLSRGSVIKLHREFFTVDTVSTHNLLNLKSIHVNGKRVLPM